MNESDDTDRRREALAQQQDRPRPEPKAPDAPTATEAMMRDATGAGCRLLADADWLRYTARDLGFLSKAAMEAVAFRMEIVMAELQDTEEVMAWCLAELRRAFPMEREPAVMVRYLVKLERLRAFNRGKFA